MHTRLKYDLMLYKVIHQVRSPSFFSLSDKFIQILVFENFKYTQRPYFKVLE